MTMDERITMNAIELTEDIGWRTAELHETIESIHYDPENVTRTGLQQLEEIKKLIKKANRIASHIER